MAFIVEALLSRSSQRFHVLWMNKLSSNDVAEAVVRGMLIDKKPESIKRADLFSTQQLESIERHMKQRKSSLQTRAKRSLVCKAKNCKGKITR